MRRCEIECNSASIKIHVRERIMRMTMQCGAIIYRSCNDYHDELIICSKFLSDVYDERDLHECIDYCFKSGTNFRILK